LQRRPCQRPHSRLFACADRETRIALLHSIRAEAALPSGEQITAVNIAAGHRVFLEWKGQVDSDPRRPASELEMRTCHGRAPPAGFGPPILCSTFVLACPASRVGPTHTASCLPVPHPVCSSGADLTLDLPTPLSGRVSGTRLAEPASSRVESRHRAGLSRIPGRPHSHGIVLAYPHTGQTLHSTDLSSESLSRHN
jgi:hypothetical protein